MSAPAFSDPPEAWDAYREAITRIDARIDPVGPSDTSREAVRRRAAAKLAGLGAFLAFAGNPQRTYAVVHVTGTSGKGSTAAAIASLLSAAGLRTGLATSPYLQVATEKHQVDGTLINGAAFRDLLDHVEDVERRWLAATPGATPLAHGQLWAAMMLLGFAADRVDAAVVEVGAGGRFDMTNVVEPVAAVITSVGLDHLATLGPGLADVAWHKAGIVKPGTLVLTGPLPPEGEAAVDAACAVRGATRIRHDRPEPGDGPDADFMERNRVLAAQVATALATSGLVDPGRIDLARAGDVALPGRVERMPEDGGPPVTLDGAHNPEKIAALAAWLARRQAAGEPPPVAVFAALAAKQADAAILALAPVVQGFVFTQAPVLGKPASPAAALETLARSLGVAVPVAAAESPREAVEIARTAAGEAGTGTLVTGSLYLAGAVRERWFPSERIVRQRTPWPAVR